MEVMLANSPLGSRSRLIDEELEVETSGFGWATSEATLMLLGRCNKRLLRTSTALWLVIF